MITMDSLSVFDQYHTYSVYHHSINPVCSYSSDSMDSVSTTTTTVLTTTVLTTTLTTFHQTINYNHSLTSYYDLTSSISYLFMSSSYHNLITYFGFSIWF